MVGLLFLSFSSSSSASCSLLQLLHKPSSCKSFMESSFATCLYHQQCSPLCRFSNTTRIELKPPVTHVCFGTSKRTFVQCRHSKLPTIPNADIGMFFSFFREVGLDEKETGILLQKNPALALTSLDSIRARIHSLSSLGIDAFTLSYLISKCPSLLTAEEIDPFVCFLHDELEGSIDPSQLKRLFATIEPRLLVGFDQKVRLLLQRGVPFEKILYILNSINLYKALCVKPLEEIDKTITFLSRFGGIDLIIRRPTLLNFDLESQLIPRVGILTKLGGGNADAIGAILRKLPAILSYSVDHVKGHVEFFRSFVGLNNEEIFKIFLVFPNVVSASRDRKLQPRMVFLKQCGLNSNEIFKFLIKAPCFMGLSFEGNLAYKLACLVKIGYRYRTKDLAGVLGSVTRTSCENLQKVIGLFLSYGFSFDDIVAMSKKHPQILQYNHSSLEKKMEYLIEDMGREVGELLAFPAFLGYKLDDRIKARYELKREILGDGMSLNKLLCVSADRFLIKKKEKKSAPLIGE